MKITATEAHAILTRAIETLRHSAAHVGCLRYSLDAPMLADADDLERLARDIADDAPTATGERVDAVMDARNVADVPAPGTVPA